MVDTSNHDSESGRLLNMFVSENIHAITSNTTLTFTRNGFETPLGPVTEPHVDRAEVFLNDLRDELGSDTELDSDSKDVRTINSEYFSLIPRKFGRKIVTSDLILTPDQLAAEYDLLDQLRTAVKTGLNADNGDADAGLNIKVAIMSPTDSKWQALNDRFESTKHRNHAEGRRYRVRNIFSLDIPDVTRRYQPVEKRLGNVRELFHGTKTANMLSIAINGFIIPPTGAAHVTGRMFGNGVYGASCSTKALNYAVGFWGGNRNRGSTAYMLVANFAMGKEYVASSHLYSGAPRGYDSVWGKAGHSLLNDEYIVYDLSQATITHILELES